MSHNQDFQLCADLGLSDFIRRWAENNPGMIGEAISSLGKFIQTGKASRVTYFAFFGDIAHKSMKKTKRAALLAFTELVEIQREKEEE